MKKSLLIGCLGLAGVLLPWLIRPAGAPERSAKESETSDAAIAMPAAQRSGTRRNTKAWFDERQAHRERELLRSRIRRELLAVLAEPDPHARVAALHDWFRENLPNRLEDLKTFYDGLAAEKDPNIFTSFPPFLEEWAKLDGSSALAYIRNHAHSNRFGHFAQHAARGWIQEDLDGFVGYLKMQQQLPTELKSPVFAKEAAYFTEQFVDLDTGAFLSWVNDLDPARNPELFPVVIKAAVHRADEALLPHVADLVGRNLTGLGPGEIVDPLTRSYLKAHPEDALEWTMQLASAPHRSKAVQRAMNDLAIDHPGLAAQWLSDDRVYAALASAPAVSDSGTGLSASETVFDMAVETYLRTFVAHHGQNVTNFNLAVASLAAIKNQALRTKMAEYLQGAGYSYFGREAFDQPAK